ncbi:unnamed protein product [Angiostrongylus costaricensis]|uniref:Uncharacterized protein n=1 Tax=Angiostrongylus costaricensis TaxID=334426 RepID=A0A0R3PPT7_ANGCS|nr:unnamed protein product [Angiostrongylus costaricensis]
MFSICLCSGATTTATSTLRAFAARTFYLYTGVWLTDFNS